MQDSTLTEPAAPPSTPYEALGGGEAIARIVNRFYDLMESEPQYAALRAMHAEDLSHMRQSLAGWLSAWAGGPRDWFEANPGKCMMSMHSGLAITQDTAMQWVEAMERAMADCGLGRHPMAQLVNDRFRLMAKAMAGPD